MSGTTGNQGGARVDRAVERIRTEGRVGLMTHIVLGYPTLEASREIALAMIRSGVDLLEIQLPFSDPTADGPTITLACHKALERGIRVADGMRLMAELCRKHPTAILFMSYFNLLFNYRGGDGQGSGKDGQRRGVEAFVEDAAAAGAAGLIVPDIPPEEDQEGYPAACRARGIHPVHVISPNSDDGRLEMIRRACSGLLYSTSRTGTTGKDVAIEFGSLGGFLDRARKVCALPLAVGFSISRREQVEALRGHAEIAVVGSHLIRIFEKHGLSALEREVRNLMGSKA